MVMFQPYIPAIILAAIYIIWLIKRPRPLRALPRLLFLSGCLLLFCYYFIPLPFDAAGFRAVSDDMLPFFDAVRIIPFSYAVECMPYTDYYFSPLIPLFCGAALLGFSVNSAFNIPFFSAAKCAHRSDYSLLAFCFLCSSPPYNGRNAQARRYNRYNMVCALLCRRCGNIHCPVQAVCSHAV